VFVYLLLFNDNEDDFGMERGAVREAGGGVYLFIAFLMIKRMI